ncbi:vibrioferrin biosynthesis PvsB domain protein, partial [Vibrio parahaemolyticus V-223/04]
FPFVLW